ATRPIDCYSLSLHDALPIWRPLSRGRRDGRRRAASTRQFRGGRPMLAVVKERPVAGVAVKQIHQPVAAPGEVLVKVRASSICGTDRKSTRLNSSHLVISYAV